MHTGHAWLEQFKWVALGAVAVGIPRILLKGLASLRHFVLDINMLMTIAIAGECLASASAPPCYQPAP